jgi:hypothetical protein
MGQLDPLCRLLFIGLWTLADCEGRLEERPKRIQAQVLPYDDCDVDRFLEELEELKFIQRYEAQGRKVIQIVNFTKHQHPHFKESTYDLPEPPEGRALDKPSTSPRQAQGKPQASRVVNGELYMGNGKRETRARAKPPAKVATRVSPALSLPIDEEFLVELQTRYESIDVRKVARKMAAHCEQSGKRPTRQRLVSWCSNEQPWPGAGNVRPASKPPAHDPGRNVPQRTKPVDVSEMIALADELERMGLHEQAEAVRKGLKPQ